MDVHKNTGTHGILLLLMLRQLKKSSQCLSPLQDLASSSGNLLDETERSSILSMSSEHIHCENSIPF